MCTGDYFRNVSDVYADVHMHTYKHTHIEGVGQMLHISLRAI